MEFSQSFAKPCLAETDMSSMSANVAQKAVSDNEVKNNIGQNTTVLLAGCNYGVNTPDQTQAQTSPASPAQGDSSHHTFSTLLLADFLLHAL